MTEIPEHLIQRAEEARRKAATMSGQPAPREHPSAENRQVFRVGYFVTVDVEAFDEGEAALVGEAALGWPGNWSPPHDPVHHTGTLNGYIVRASIIRSQAMMAKPKESA